MIDLLRSHVDPLPAHQRWNAAREYLQWLILQAMDDGGFRRELVFTGGTCRRIVFGSGRFSEDLDFSLAKGVKGFESIALKQELLRRFKRLGLQAESSPVNIQRIVHSFFLRFTGLPHALGLSPIKKEKLSIKIEVDTKPPTGGKVEEFLFQDPILFLVNHFDLPSLFATKLHAFLFRGYDKGRDYYDLFFFLRKKITPSLDLFRKAAKQTHPELKYPSQITLVQAIREKLESMDEKKILRDVGPFLLDPSEERFLRKSMLIQSLKQAFP